MRAFGFVILVGVVAAACGDEDNRQPPDTAIDTQPAVLTNQARATFVFRAIGVSNSFICSIDGAESNCVPPAIFDLADGEHTFSVAAAFNQIVDETPATYTWRIDTAAPTTTLLAAPPAVDNDTTPELVF